MLSGRSIDLTRIFLAVKIKYLTKSGVVDLISIETNQGLEKALPAISQILRLASYDALR